MDQNCKAVVEKRIQRTMESLQKNNMQAYYAATKEDTVAQVAGLLKPDDVISFGGSMSLRECGVMELLRSGSYPKLMDRDQKGLTREQVQEIYRKSFFADVYLMSSNCDKGGVTRKLCKVGCIGCMKCVKACESGAVTVNQFKASVDPAKCTACGKCVEVCPQDCIRMCLEGITIQS